MADLARKLDRLPIPHELSARWAWGQLFFLQLLVLSFLGVVCCSVATAQDASIPNGRVARSGVIPTFAIADFDGDGRPDFATIETGVSGYAGTHYWVYLRLSSIGRQSIQIVGPSGGLRIEAIDVNNGNHFVDLALTTILTRQPVAILINDGSGDFSQVPPSAFPEAFSEPGAELVSTRDRCPQAVAVLLQQRPAVDSQAVRTIAAQLQNDLVPVRDSRLALVTFLNARATRAPPSNVH